MERKKLLTGRQISLIKSILGSLSVYHLSLSRALVNIIYSIEQIRRDFCCGVTGDEKKVCWLSWDRMLALKVNRGAVMVQLGRQIKLYWQNGFGGIITKKNDCRLDVFCSPFLS